MNKADRAGSVARTLGRDASGRKPEEVVKNLAAFLANVPPEQATLRWSNEEGRLVARVEAGAAKYALAAAADDAAARALVLDGLACSMVHEATQCRCTGVRCPSFVAFARERDEGRLA